MQHTELHAPPHVSEGPSQILQSHSSLKNAPQALVSSRTFTSKACPPTIDKLKLTNLALMQAQRMQMDAEKAQSAQQAAASRAAASKAIGNPRPPAATQQQGAGNQPPTATQAPSMQQQQPAPTSQLPQMPVTSTHLPGSSQQLTSSAPQSGPVQ